MDNGSQQNGTGRGLFITFEGGDGAGKTTHIKFLAKSLRERGWEVVCLREPGGTALGERLRALLLNPENADLSSEAELFLYEAARAQLVVEVIRPALARGAVVLCDRFTDSTLAYQGFGRELDCSFVDRANAFASQGIVPDRTILMVTGEDPQVGLARATKHQAADRMELAGEAFHERVDAGFESLAQKHAARVRRIVSADKKSRTSQAVFRELVDLFPWMADLIVCDEAFFSPLDAKRVQVDMDGGRVHG